MLEKSATLEKNGLARSRAFLVGCGERPVAMDDTQRQRVTAAVEDAIRSFEQAERARDAEALIAHFAPVADFHIYSDQRTLQALSTPSVVSGFSA